MNTLELKKIGYEYAVENVKQEEPHYQTEYVVDGIGISELFNFSKWRPWFGETEFESSDRNIISLKGLSAPNNQLGNGFFVLYRCHCGSDYCGVIACRIIREDDVVVWDNIYYGDENGPYESVEDKVYDLFIVREKTFRFNSKQYDYVIDAYCKAQQSKPKS